MNCALAVLPVRPRTLFPHSIPLSALDPHSVAVMDADIALSAGMQQTSEHKAAAAGPKAAPASSSASSSSSSSSRPHAPKPLASPPPPHVPSYLAPAPKEYKGYKLDPAGLPCTIIPLAKPLDMSEGSAPTSAASSAGTGTNAAPTSFHAVSQKLKANQLVVLRSETERGAHAVYYCDHKGIWQLDPPGSVSAADGKASPSAQGGSHLLYEFDSVEDGDGLSFVGVSPCILLLTRGGGRLTIFLVRPEAGHQLDTSGADAAPITVLFDGSPLSPAPLSPHHATISSALLSAHRDRLFVVLYEYWPEHVDAKAVAARQKGIEFVHQSDALRAAGDVSPTEVTEGFSAIATTAKHALHKLTLVQFSIHNVAALRVTGEPMRNASAEGTPNMQLIHSFSSVQNQLLAADDMPPQFANDSYWSAPLACWLQLPTHPTHHTATTAPASARCASTSPHPLPCLWYVVARVPYLNETESVLHEMERLEADKTSADKQPVTMDRADEIGTESVPVSAIGSGAASASSSAAAAPKFTSESLLGHSHNLKNYSVDAEDDDDEFMNETGLAIDDPSRTSLNRNRDAEVSLFDRMGNLLARRSFKGQQFLFATNHESVSHGTGPGNGSKASSVVGVKSGEELVLYAVSSAPQSTPEGLSLGAGGCCSPGCSAQTPGLGIVLKPLLSFAGLGYVVSGKPHRKFFLSDAAHSFVMLVEYTRLGYVYGRPSAGSPTAPQYLIQLAGDEEDQGQQMYGCQTVLVPAAGGGSSEAPVQGKPLLYLLTRHSCRQFQLPLVALPA